MSGRSRAAEPVHWLLPINPAAHPEHMPTDWRTREDATAVWEAIGRSQPVERWCLSTGFRTMKSGDTLWVYLSGRQELCAVGTVRQVVREGGVVVAGGESDTAGGAPSGAQDGAQEGLARWFVLVDWDERRTAALCRKPVPRSVFGQVPMSTCRMGTQAVLALGVPPRDGARRGTE